LIKKIEDDAVRKLSNLKKQEYETKVKADDKKNTTTSCRGTV